MARKEDSGDARRSKWPSSEDERWWLGAVTYAGGFLATVLVTVLILAIVLTDLWIVLVVVAGVVLVGLVLTALVNGEWW